MAVIDPKEIGKQIRSDMILEIDMSRVKREVFGFCQWRLKLALVLVRIASRLLSGKDPIESNHQQMSA